MMRPRRTQGLCGSRCSHAHPLPRAPGNRVMTRCDADTDSHTSTARPAQGAIPGTDRRSRCKERHDDHETPSSAVALTTVAALMLGASSVLAACHPVPFTATYSGSAAFASATPASFVGPGTATHLGRIATTGMSDFSCGVGSHCPVSNCPDGVPNVNTETLTAANGDTLTIVSTDVACPIPGLNLAFHGTGHWVVTGGTGRFAGASGQGTLDGHSDFGAGTFQFTVTGSVSRPNSGA